MRESKRVFGNRTNTLFLFRTQNIRVSSRGIPDGVIDYCLGHSDKSKGIIRYYTRVKQKQAEIAINRVIDYTNSPEKYTEFLEMRADIMLMKDK